MSCSTHEKQNINLFLKTSPLLSLVKNHILGQSGAPKLMAGVLVRISCEHTEKQKRNTGEKVMWKQKQRLGWSSCKPRNAKNCGPQPDVRGEAWNRFSLSFQREPTLWTPWFHISNLQNCAWINSCCFKLLSLWLFITEALGNEYNPETHFPVGHICQD